MSWAELSNGIWTIPASRHKSKQEALVPLSKAAARMLQSLPRIEGTPWVFTAGGKGALSGFSRIQARVSIPLAASPIGLFTI